MTTYARKNMVGELIEPGEKTRYVRFIGDEEIAAEVVEAFDANDATPSVIVPTTLYKTANTVATTISDFDDGYTGQVITVIIDDANTTVDFTSSSLVGNGGADWSPSSGDSMRCVLADDGNWYCQVPGAGAGAGIGTINGLWDYDNTTTSADPGAGIFRLNNTNPSLATNIYINSETETGVDFDVLLGALADGDKVYLQNVEDSTEALLASVNGTPTDNTGWWTIPITVDDSQGNPWTDGKDFGVILFIGVAPGSGTPTKADTGFRIIGDINTGTPPTSEAITAKIQYYDNDETDLIGEAGFDGNRTFEIQNFMRGSGSGAGFAVRVDNGSGTSRTPVSIDGGGNTTLRGGETSGNFLRLQNNPANETYARFIYNSGFELYYNNVIKLEAENSIQSGTSSVVLRSQANNDTTYNYMHWTRSDGSTLQARMGITTTPVFEIRNMVHGADLYIRCENNSGTGVNHVVCDPDANTTALGNFVFDLSQSVGAGTDNYVLTYDNSDGEISLEPVPGGAIDTKHKTADTSRSSTTTLADDTHLAGWSLDADSYYKIEGWLHVDFPVDATPDIKFRPQFSNTPQDCWWTFKGANDNGSTTDSDHAQYTSNATLNVTVANDWGFFVSGYIRSNATTGGTFDVQWAQNTFSANATVLKLGSWMTLTKIS